jgi:hypothetical protein
MNKSIDNILNILPNPREFDNTLAGAIRCCLATPDGFFMPPNVMEWLKTKATEEEWEVLRGKLHDAMKKAKEG